MFGVCAAYIHNKMSKSNDVYRRPYFTHELKNPMVNQSWVLISLLQHSIRINQSGVCKGNAWIRSEPDSVTSYFHCEKSSLVTGNATSDCL